MSGLKTPKVGKLRPSGAVTQHGPGAIVDLPELSVVIAGINHWHPTAEDVVPEPRLVRFLGVSELLRPPQPGPGKFGGVPSFVFPEYLVCPRCRYLAPHQSFTRRAGWTYAEFRCPRVDKHPSAFQPTAFPARFMVACPRGHLDDFPWHDWVHGGRDDPCSGVLELRDLGTSGSANDLMVKCTTCDDSKRLGNAFDKNAHGGCTGRRPWIGLSDHEECGETQRTILRGASNAFFSVVASAISIPPWSDPIHQEIAPYLKIILEQAGSLEKLKSGIEGGFYDLGDLTPTRFSVEEVWAAATAEPEAEDLKDREWKAFANPDEATKPGTEFEVRSKDVPGRFVGSIGQVVAASRLREVRALRGFTRIDSMPEAGEAEDVEELNIVVAPISDKKRPTWLPAVDLRGEGIFIRLQEEGPSGLQVWEQRTEVIEESERLEALWREWRDERGLDDRPFTGLRYVLVHTLAHVLMRQLALDSGYSSSSVRERLYVRSGEDPMAGVLLYTATNDSDGSLGGLVDQAKPDRLGPLLMDALREASRCAQDPLCGGRDVGGNAHMNGSACHACLLLSETSCEFANRLLDRSVLVPTLGDRGLEFFHGR